VLHDPRAWSVDRLHLSTDGHRRIALRAAEVLGVPVAEDWREPLPPADPLDWAAQRRADLRWTREHFLPWVGRRLRGRSCGDGVPPKRPDLAPLGRGQRASTASLSGHLGAAADASSRAGRRPGDTVARLP